MYLIRNLCPRDDIDMGCHGFCIDLSEDWPEMVAKSKLSADNIATLIDVEGRRWLDGCGYTGTFDPDNCGVWADRSKPPGPNARPSYEPRTSIRVSWGPWGVEHITVPGDACGLDMDNHSFGSFLRGGRRLLPHNIDSWQQKQLLLVVFCEIAESIVLFSQESP